MTALQPGCPFNECCDGYEIVDHQNGVANHRVEDFFFNATYQEVDLPLFRCNRVGPLKQPKNVFDEARQSLVGLLDSQSQGILSAFPAIVSNKRSCDLLKQDSRRNSGLGGLEPRTCRVLGG